MFVLKTRGGLVVTIKAIDPGRIMRLGVDPDDVIACFSTHEEAVMAATEGESKNYDYRHSLEIQTRFPLVVEAAG